MTDGRKLREDKGGGVSQYFERGGLAEAGYRPKDIEPLVN